MTITGGCLCGAVRFEASAPPRRVTHCHCDMCRRAIGAAVATFATFESARVHWSSPPARYDSSERAWRGFCPTCGSSVCFGFKPRPERIYVTVGIFDAPDAYPAGFHDYRAEKIRWLHVDDDLPDAPGRAVMTPPDEEGGESVADRPELDRLVEQLKQARDELKVQANLAKADLRDEWEDLEKKWSHLRARLDVIGDATEEAAGDVLDAVKLVGEELKSSYERIRRLL